MTVSQLAVVWPDDKRKESLWAGPSRESDGQSEFLGNVTSWIVNTAWILSWQQ